MAIDDENFITWLSDMTGDKPIELAAKLGVSPSLISRYASRERRPTLAVLKKIRDIYNINLDVLQQNVFQYQSSVDECNMNRATISDAQALKILELEEQLSRLKNPRFALSYSLKGRLPPSSIEKLMEIVHLEIKYTAMTNRNEGDENDF